MLNFILFSVAVGALVCAAAPASNPRRTPFIESRAIKYSLPSGNPIRAAAIATKRLAFTYGLDPAGTSIYYPSGALGIIKTTADFAGLDLDAVPHLALVQADALAASLAVTAVSEHF
jgi:hypothetical protein